ncbi:methyltransferase domain-containing protein [Lutibacter sp. B1]|uniref:methyltransferase domain-containing protein n=1 Tax=Lutibacter sp. B1 TaxID=2725996 RepID=UPI0014575F9B|nr:methyltransferase domain-containing protein [Lutibacter sp. B1]NLP56560.1 methyltransferase domain-containing protein [Lutibacter sp. B1]
MGTDYNFEKHWNNAYLKTPINSLGWYEKEATQSLNLIELCNLPKEASVFNPGAGASSLIEELLNRGYTNLTVNDISSIALSELRNSLSKHKHSEVKFVVDDLTNPTELLKLKNIDLWHDRAVLHFFTLKEQQNTYFNLLKKVLKPNGFVILAQFNLEGAKKCSGLDVVNYNEEMLQEKLGNEFILLESFNHTYFQPSGNTREFVYTLFQRKA